MTLPGNSALATVVSACTLSPTFTRTSPGNGRIRLRRTVVRSVTVSPGV